MFSLRFDMRAPTQGVPAADLYKSAIEMADYSEKHGAFYAMVSEHHGVDDGYLPSPMVLASAMASRTSTLPIIVAVVILPLYDPIKLAEDMSVLDLVSNGRVSYVAALGYRSAEYEMFGETYKQRGRIADEKLELLLKAKTGEPFQHNGMTLKITPAPFTPGGPMVAWGGGSLPAARRAGRNGIGFFGQKDDEELKVAYEKAALENNHTPGMCVLPPRDSATVVFVADDVDKAWDELGPYLMHDVRSYAEWNEGNEDITSLSFVSSAEELRAENRSHRILSTDEAIEWVRAGQPLALHPLIGGLPPEIAWSYLRHVTEVVMPAAAGGN
jgi:alkanesulfonate monooxygenase SsuD/methylene tetrahydromethanopterin reductase-like flavin-dependent oxidoreductase (luciferase family)